MALQKTKSKNGYDASYWRILQVNSNMDRNDCVVTLGLYKDQTTREADANSIMESVQFDLGSYVLNDAVTDDDTYKNIKLKECYKILKSLAVAEDLKEEKNESLSFFSNAEDV